MRATATTTAPNFVRSSVVVVTIAFQLLKPAFGVSGSAIAVGAITLLVAGGALLGLEETYGKSLEFVE